MRIIPLIGAITARLLFYEKVREAAEQVGISVYIAEGSNVDDDGDYRPGKRAVQEAGVISPLKEAGLTEAEIRQLQENGTCHVG